MCGTAPAAVFAARFPGGLNDTVLYASAVEAYTSEPMLSFPAIGGGRGIFAAGAGGLGGAASHVDLAARACLIDEWTVLLLTTLFGSTPHGVRPT